MPITSGLAELHIHLHGTIDADDFLDFLSRGEPKNWGFYEQEYHRAYGVRPSVSRIIERYKSGDTTALAEFRRLFVYGDSDAGTFARFQAKYNILVSGTDFMNIPDTGNESIQYQQLASLFTNIVKKQMNHGVTHAEQRVPLQMADGAAGIGLLRAMLQLSEDVSTDEFNATVAVSMPRDNPMTFWPAVRSLALDSAGARLTGIDFCYVEEGHPPKEKEEFFRTVHEFNRQHPERALAILYHVGESFSDKSLESAIRWVHEAAELGAHRLGHAIALGVDPRRYGNHHRWESLAEHRDQLQYDARHATRLRQYGVPVDTASVTQELLKLRGADAGERVEIRYNDARIEEVRRRQLFAMDRVAEAGAVVEVCPTSNRRIGGIIEPAQHPVRRFWEREVPFVVSTDDPGIFGATLSSELEWVAGVCDLDAAMVRGLADRSWRYRSELLSGRTQANQ